MKKTLSLKLFFVLILLGNCGVYADEIWNKDFSDNLNKGYWGTNSDLSGVTDWTLDVSNCILENDDDYVKVVETSEGRFEAVDCDGEAIWQSESIDISSFTNCSISIVAAETGTSTNDEKYIKFYYKLDGGEEIALDNNAVNIGNWGSAEGTCSFINGTSLVIVVRMNNPLSSNKVYFDDILVSGEPIVPEMDELTILKSTDDPINPLLIDTKIDTKEEAITCFRFAIDETSSASDGEPTRVSRMTFFNENPENSLNWETQLGGFLFSHSGSVIEPQNTVITNDSIYLDFNEGQIDVPEGGSLIFDIKVYLNSNVSLNENQTIQLKIGEYANGFNVYSGGSGFSSSNGEISSNIHAISVDAKVLEFTEIPFEIVRNQYFSVKSEATDIFGNLDVDQQNIVKLSLNSGTGILRSNTILEKPLKNGFVVFDSLQYENIESISLKLIGEDLKEVISDEILVLNTFDSNVIQSVWTPSNTTISSTQVTKDDLFEIFRFTVVDGGDDGLPTILNKMLIKTSNANQVDLKKSIEKVFIQNAVKELKADIEISKDELIISFGEDEIGRIIESEGTSEYSLFVYLKEGEAIDGEKLQLKIEQSSAEWETSIEGSGLKSEFSEVIIGPEFITEVEAVRMRFAELPDYVPFQNEFQVEIELVDEYENRDINSDDEIELSLASGNGDLSSVSGLNKTNEGGLYIWSDLIYSKAEIFNLQAESDGFSTILSDNISSVDNDSEIIFSSHNPALKLNPLAVSDELSQSVLKFKIVDSGSNDDLPTILNTLKFHKEITTNDLNWNKHIAGAILKQNNIVFAKTSDINSNYIRFTSSNGLIEIPNSTELEYELAIYFRKSQLPDNATVQISIPKENFAWKTGNHSSELVDVLDQNIISAIHEVDVLADRLSIIKVPFYITDSLEIFDLQVATCDKHQNIDLDKNISFELKANSNDLIFDDSNTETINGIATIGGINYSGSSNFSITTKSDLIPDTCKIFVGTPSVDIQDDFEESSLENWQNTMDWKISTFDPIFGNSSLKHNLINQSGESYIGGEVSNWNPHSGTLQWSFVLRNGDWDPSSGNYFGFNLLMDSQNPELSEIRYVVGINYKDSDDLIGLWKIVKDESPELLVSSDFNWNDSEAVAIAVDYDASGEWTLKYNRIGENYNWLLAGSEKSLINLNSQSWFYALQFNFETASRAGELWFDDLIIQSANTEPYVRDYEIIGQDSILIVFSENLNTELALLPNKYKIFCNDKELNDYSISVGKDAFEIVIVMNNEFQTGNYFVELFDITDQSGMECKYDSVEFEYFAPVKSYDVVINEIMADETPSNGLPEYEYIELYNTKEHAISVQDWVLTIGEKELKLNSDTIKANSFLILCSNSAKDDFTVYGNALGVSSFSSLTNAGTSVRILSGEGVTIDSITYSIDWYKSVEKSNGGWSLERIDPVNTCSSIGNWSASDSEIGGTPGTQNSIWSENLDQKLPQVLSFNLISKNQISIEFDEYMDSESLIKLENYSVADNELTVLEKLSPQKVALSFEKDFQDGIEQQLVLNNLLDECGNVLDTTLSFIRYDVHEYDVVINEIMADETPTNGLPEHEYIELYNTKEYAISVQDWFLTIGDKELKLNSDTIKANSYLILCSNSAKDDFTVYGNALGVSSFSGLTNAGTSISLRSTEGILLDSISYSIDWYKSDEKNDGGWSLERIDPMNTCSSFGNWLASDSEKGGTPGTQNSILFENLDQKLPQVLSFNLISKNHISIEFDEFMDSKSLIKSENYSIADNELKQLEKLSSQKVALSFEKDFQDGIEQQLVLNNLLDECGNILDSILTFTRYDVHEYDVVINEIMADENPTNGLPEYEYIELYNTQSHDLSVKDWTVGIGEKELKLKADTIKANSYLILCSSSAMEDFSVYGNTLGVSNFSGLTNAGTTISLKSTEGILLDSITYSIAWYKSDEKNDGGWSLERIDPMNTTWQTPNWAASINIIGGTPGSINSIFKENKDVNSPVLEKLIVSSANSIQLNFSEPMFLNEIKNLKNFTLLESGQHPISVVNVENLGILFELIFQDNFVPNLKYELSIDQKVTDLAQNPLSKDVYEFWIPSKIQAGDVVINEVLFNPLSGGADYVELYNTSDNILDLSKSYLAERDENYLLTDSVKISDEQLILRPQNYILLTADTLNVRENYYTNDWNVFKKCNLPSYGDKSGRVVLLSETDLIDDFAYDEKMHFSLLASVEGVALERINPKNKTNSTSNWQSAAQSIGYGTPGVENSVFSDEKMLDNEVSLSNKIFSPDSDGQNDRLYINFNLKDDGFVVNVRIYNSIGKEVRKLANKYYLAMEDKIYWDGLNSSKERLPIGIYLVYIELFNSKGDVKTFKKTCVLGGKFN